MLELVELTFSTLGVAGFAALWVVKAVAGMIGLKWLRDRNTRRRGTG